MEDLALKMRLAVLWLFVAVTMSANTLLYLIVPGVIDEIRAGEVVGMQASPELLLFMAVVLLDTVGYGYSVSHFERKSEPVGQHNPGHILCRIHTL